MLRKEKNDGLNKAEKVHVVQSIKRWTKIGLRTLHLLAVAGVGGGVLFGLDPVVWLNYWWLALASGGLLILIDSVANPLWIVQVRGLVIVVKLLLLALLGRYPAFDGLLLVIVIIISTVIAHAPGKIRYYSVYHRREISSSKDTKG